MKKLHLLSLVLVLALLFTSCSILFPSDEPKEEETTKLTITSETEVTLELGQSYTLTYETDGSVTVAVSGGSYDADSQKFTATEAGTYTITATAKAEGKKDAVATVTVTVTAASADKTALSNSIKNTEGLIKSDYTSATWKALDDAVKAAKAIQEKAGVSQDEVDAAAAAVDKALAELASALVKAELSEDSFTWNETTYKAEDYYNFADILAELQALNANAEITLKSQYTPEIDKILAKLEAKIKLNVKGDLINGASMIVEELVEYTLTADSDEGVTYSWTVDGVEVSTTAELKFTPAEYKTYEIVCTVSNGTNTNVKTISVAFVEADYVVNGKFTDSINVDNNVISVTNGLGWGDEEGKKVTLPDLRLSGDFTVYFDVEFKTAAQPGVMALFFNNAEGNNELDWIAICQQANWLEVAVGGSENEKFRLQMTNDTTIALNTKLGFMATRTIVDGKAYFKAYLIDEAGNVLATNEPDAYSNYTGVVQLGIQAENAQFVVSNLAVGINDNAISKTTLNKALALSASLVESDYTAESWKALVDAKAAASAATTQAEINAAASAVVAATNGLVVADLVKADTTDGNIVYGGKTYSADNYENIADVVAELETLNADATITLNSVYAPKAQAIIAKLISKVTLEIAGAPENGVQYLVTTLPGYAMTASASEGATIAWSVNGAEVSTDASYTFVPADFGTYTISCVATKGEYSAEKEYTVSFVNAGWTSNKPGAKVENNVITITEGYGWDDMKGKKVTTNDLTLSGNFTVYFDLTFNNQNGVNVFALFLLKANGDINNDWVAITSQNNKLEVSCLEQKAYRDMTEGATSIGTKTSYVVTREIIDGRAYITAYQLDVNGNIVVTNDGTQDNGNRVSSDYTGPVVLGIQSEWAHFEMSNVRLNADAKVNCKADLRALVSSTNSIIKTDYVDSVVSVLNEKVNAANAVLANADAEQAAIDEAYAALAAAIAEIKPENYVEVTKAEVTEDTIFYSITGLTLKKDELYNFNEIAATVNTLNGSDEFAANSVYTAALTEALNSADYKITLSTVDWNGLVSNTNYVTSMNPSYNLAVNCKTKNVSYVWTVNGEEVGTDGSYVLVPESGVVYNISVKLQKNGEGYENETVTFELVNVGSVEADVKTPMGDRVSVTDNGGFTSTTGIGWGDWEGRKVVYDDLVFNGSFSISMDITYNGTSGGATVATIHLLNADTLSPSFGGDWAYVGYGCICLHENPVRLETNWVGTGKRQSSDGGFEAVAAAMSAAMSQLEVGDTFTVKLTCYRNANRQLQLVYALYNAETGEWIEFNRNEWAGDMGGGFIVGINIENVGMTASNVRYELLEETGDHLAGSVKSRAALSAALVKYENIVPSEYINSAAFVAAYNAAWAMMDDNSVNADYDTAAANLVAAAEALVKRDVAVSAGALDKGYSNYTGVDQFEAVIGVAATDVKWTYNLNGEAKEVAGNVLPLEVGAYTDVKLSFSVDGAAYTYQYQNFNVTALNLKSNVGAVTIDGETVRVDNGDGWGHKEQLVIDGIYTQEFELVFNAKYDGTPGGAYQVMCINLFGEDIRPVFGYQREDRGNRGQLGFDNNGQWADINNTDAEGEAYDHIFGAATKFSVKVSQDAEGKFWITFTVYGADGNVIESRTCDWTRWYDSKTAIRFTFENIDLTLSDFEVYYN